MVLTILPYLPSTDSFSENIFHEIITDNHLVEQKLFYVSKTTLIVKA